MSKETKKELQEYTSKYAVDKTGEETIDYKPCNVSKNLALTITNVIQHWSNHWVIVNNSPHFQLTVTCPSTVSQQVTNTLLIIEVSKSFRHISDCPVVFIHCESSRTTQVSLPCVCCHIQQPIS